MKTSNGAHAPTTEDEDDRKLATIAKERKDLDFSLAEEMEIREAMDPDHLGDVQSTLADLMAMPSEWPEGITRGQEKASYMIHATAIGLMSRLEQESLKDFLKGELKWGRDDINGLMGVAKEQADLYHKEQKLEARKAQTRMIVRKGPAADIPGLRVYDWKPEDGGIMDCWLEYYSEDQMFVTGFNKWYAYTGTHWEKDMTARVSRQILELMNSLNNQANIALSDALDQEDKDDVAKARAYISATKRTNGRRESIEAMAGAFKAKSAADLDTSNGLNLLNGVLDLDTFEHRPHAKEDLFAYVLPYKYNEQAECPRWDQFMREVLVLDVTGDPDEELIALFQELVGYSLTTSTEHHAMIFMQGAGGNGKSVVLTILRGLLGPMVLNADFHNIGNPGDYQMAGVAGKRVLMSGESDKGKMFKESIIKDLVSGEVLKGRPIYGSDFEFKPVAKIWWAMNNKPPVMDGTDSIWRRLKLIPFNRQFKDHEKDIELPTKLLAELPGILNWALAGLQRLRRNGRFTESITAIVATDRYRTESNSAMNWLSECTIAAESPAHGTKAGTLYNHYRNWCHENGKQPFHSNRWSDTLKMCGYSKSEKRTATGWNWDIKILAGDLG